MSPTSVLRVALSSVALAFSCCVLPAVSQERIVNVLGWGDYVDPRVLTDFTRTTGIEVTYESYSSDESLETALQPGSRAFDVVIVSSSVLRKQIARGLYQKLDKSKIPNAVNLWPEIMERLATYDPGNEHAVNYAWFAMGIAYDVVKARELMGKASPSADFSFDSWGLLFQQKNLKKLSSCGVGILDSPEDLSSAALQYLWSNWRLSPGLDRRTDGMRAAELLTAVRRDSKRLDSRDYVNALVNGDVCVAVGFSLDSLRARYTAGMVEEFVEIEFFIPQEGAPIRLDNLVIPKDAPHVEEAYKFIDFLLQPEIAARNTNFIGVANGVLASKSLVDGSISRNKSIYPDAAMMKRLVAPPLDDGAPTTGQTISREGTPIGRATWWGLGRRVPKPAKSSNF
ncbi:extracellular solute-binding protein [Methylocystis rosea]|uniref:Putrescine-binding periplasmic protein n=1 Tax=Methylocystis rosea TaxID=173366 RepID=A0A3G8M3S0_9HYPH|nr:extracellular solute-binding protein [Methylocystis rosea]AZG76586.1 extracellular solute-binding protein [Methylocystis rosea]